MNMLFTERVKKFYHLSYQGFCIIDGEYFWDGDANFFIPLTTVFRNFLSSPFEPDPTRDYKNLEIALRFTDVDLNKITVTLPIVDRVDGCPALVSCILSQSLPSIIDSLILEANPKANWLSHVYWCLSQGYEPKRFHELLFYQDSGLMNGKSINQVLTDLKIRSDLDTKEQYLLNSRIQQAYRFYTHFEGVSNSKAYESMLISTRCWCFRRGFTL
jgi:hypothetical protein